MKKKLTITLLVLFFCSSLISQILTDSDLPIIIINTDGEIDYFQTTKGSMKIIYRGTGQKNFTSDQNNPAYLNYDGRIDIKIRGNSSLLIDKHQYKITTRKADDITNNNISLLGMPPENDWILNGMAGDRARIRDYLTYNFSRQIGEYASRAVYCELIINGNYQGLYLLSEKIKADDSRVNIVKMGLDDNNLPELSGGYIILAEESENAPIAWTMKDLTGQDVYYFHEFPDPSYITQSQHDYIHNQFLDLELTARLGNASIINGFPSIIDMRSFVNFIIINELASNPDAYWGSTYFHKDRNGKLRAGPVWDFDLAFGSGRSKPDVWQFGGSDGISSSDNGGSRFWIDLFNNVYFKCCLSKRWNELIQPGHPLTLLSLNSYIDQIVTTISEAIQRDYARWGLPANSHQLYIAGIKEFLATRVPWMTNAIGGCSPLIDFTTPSLVITKIMYHPDYSIYSSDNDDFEFIEITNNSKDTADLTGVYFGGTGFVYQFPVLSNLGPYKSLILASNSKVFQLKYGFVPCGQFTRHLSNKSENLLLLDAFGNEIDNVNYCDSSPWPEADGNGYYLKLIDVGLDNSIATSWVASNSPISPEDYPCSTLTPIDSTPTFVNNIISESDLKVYPNPTKDILTIEAPCLINSVCLFDVYGILHEKILINEKEYIIDMNGYADGIYILRVVVEDKIFSVKIIKD